MRPNRLTVLIHIVACRDKAAQAERRIERPQISPLRLQERLMVDFHKGYAEDYSAEDFEQAAQRLLGDRYLELKALNASPAQICNEFSQHFFNGPLTETPDNSDDITLLLTVSMDIYVGCGSLNYDDSGPAVSTKEAPSLSELLVSDIAPGWG